MTMTARGLAKLVEELGELAQVIGKRLAYYSTDEHPDGGPPLSERLTDELADVLASCRLVATLNDVDAAKLEARVQRKMTQFAQWESEAGNNQHGVDALYKQGILDALAVARAADPYEGRVAAIEAIESLLGGAEPLPAEVEQLRNEVTRLRGELNRVQYRREPFERPDHWAERRPWHSPHCYERSGAHRDESLCTCGLTALRNEVEQLRRERETRIATSIGTIAYAALRSRVLAEIERWRSSAHALRGEVERGECLRQSAESKLARVQVLESAADTMQRALDGVGATAEPPPLPEGCATCDTPLPEAVEAAWRAHCVRWSIDRERTGAREMRHLLVQAVQAGRGDGGTWANPPPGFVVIIDHDAASTRHLVERDERLAQLIAEAARAAEGQDT